MADLSQLELRGEAAVEFNHQACRPESELLPFLACRPLCGQSSCVKAQS